MQEDVMPIWSKVTAAVAGCLSAAIAATAVNAAEVNMLATGSMQDLLGALVPAFERASGHKFTVRIESSPAILSKVKADESFDLVLAGTDTIGELVKAGKFLPTVAVISCSPASGLRCVPARRGPTSAHPKNSRPP
jgi:molybdate transport system substrate-binding protein